jgi:RNA polymerase sigma factor (sigma-70 family)
LGASGVKTGRARILLRCLRQAAPEDGLTDGQLLGRYAARHDDAAFEALVRRHGPMVLAVCRRVLGHAQDAEDSFQATFLVLARRAAAVARRPAVGGWLCTVAYHASLAARASALRRRARERQVEDMPHPTVAPRDDRRELLEMLDRELARLPEKYRLPVVLCELEGRSRKEAARQLGLPEGTLSSRLATARKTLAARLSRCGLAVSAAALGAVLAEGARAACVPGRLLVSTVRIAGGLVPAGVAALTEGVMKSILLTKLNATTWGLLLAAAITAGAVALTYGPAAAQPAPKADPAPAAKSANRDELEALRLEVEALRLDLKATKQRVTALEDHEAQALAGNGNAAWTGGWQAGPNAGSYVWANTQPRVAAAPSEDVKQLAAEVEAAAKKLGEKPDDKEALAELNCAVERLRKARERKNDP